MNNNVMKCYIAIDKLISEIGPVSTLGFSNYRYNIPKEKTDRKEATSSIFTINTFKLNDPRLNISRHTGDANEIEIEGYIYTLEIARAIYEYSKNHNLRHVVDNEHLPVIFKELKIEFSYLDKLIEMTN